jgi:hypothetical protein
MQLLYGAGVISWAINVVMDIYLTPQGDRGPYRLLTEGAGPVLAAGSVWYAGFGNQYSG